MSQSEARHDHAESTPATTLEALRQRLTDMPDRRSKARAAAAWLFFEQGEHPSVARVREIIGTGSMNDLSRDLREFWADLRGRMQTKLQAPDLPQEIVESMGSALSSIWNSALRKADETLAEERAHAQAEVAAAHQEAAQARALMEQSNELLQAEKRAAEEAAREQARLQAEAAALAERLAAAEQQAAEMERIHAQRMQEKADEIARMQAALEAERAAAARRLETLDGELRFAKMQIAHAREAGDVFKRELERLRSERSIEEATMQRTLNGLREELGASRLRAEALASQVSELQGQLRALRPLRKAAAALNRKAIPSHQP